MPPCLSQFESKSVHAESHLIVLQRYFPAVSFCLAVSVNTICGFFLPLVLSCTSALYVSSHLLIDLKFLLILWHSYYLQTEWGSLLSNIQVNTGSEFGSVERLSPLSG